MLRSSKLVVIARGWLAGRAARVWLGGPAAERATRPGRNAGAAAALGTAEGGGLVRWWSAGAATSPGESAWRIGYASEVLRAVEGCGAVARMVAREETGRDSAARQGVGAAEEFRARTGRRTVTGGRVLVEPGLVRWRSGYASEVLRAVEGRGAVARMVARGETGRDSAARQGVGAAEEFGAAARMCCGESRGARFGADQDQVRVNYA